MSAILEGRTAWVTGGGSGIGLAGAIELARAGCRVVISGREPARLAQALERAAREGVPDDAVVAVPLDVADRSSVEQAAREIQDRFGPVSVLVNNAGINFPRRFWAETDGETFDKVVAVNLSGAAHCTLAVIHGMRALGHGTVINVASFVGWHLTALTGPAYTATKAGLIALSHSFNLEEGVHGLRATALCPGEVVTPILRSRPVAPSAEDEARMLQEGDLGRTIRFIAELPRHVCVNELVISPVYNRLYLGAPEFAKKG